jgi:hypothetical protein
VPEKNGVKIKVVAMSAIGGLIIVVVTLFGFAKGAVDERIDVKILGHEMETEQEHQQDIAEIKQDIAVMEVQQQQIADDISDIKDLLREQ